MGNMSKDKSKNSNLILYIIAGVVVAIIGIWMGFVLSDTATGKGDLRYERALNHLSDYTTISCFFSAIKGYIQGDEITRRFGNFGLLGGFIVVMFKLSKTPKRLHRKGVEHGSARWGNDKEKKSLSDPLDFYNNIIIAGDIFLVLNRKKRDLNALTPKQKKKFEDEEKEKKVAEENRVALLQTKSEKIKSKYSPVGNSDDKEINEVKHSDFITKGTTLVAYVGKSKNVIIPENITEIGEFSFAHNSDIEVVTLSSSTTTISAGAFYNCENLKSIIAFDNLTKIDDSAFENTYALSEIHLPKSLAKIGDNAFKKALNPTFIIPQNSVAEKFANENNFTVEFSEQSVNVSDDNEKISIDNVLKKNTTSKIKQMLNLNVVIFGGSGTGKSRFWVKPNLLQCNTSFVVTDPAGELLRDCGRMLERQGYKIKVFNLNDMKYSSNYNPFHYLKDSSGICNPNNVIKMINTFMMNCNGEDGGNSGDPFWDNATKLLLSAVCFLLVETADEEEQNFSNVLDLIRKMKVIEGKEEEKSEVDLIFDQRKEVAPNALSVQYYDEFKQAAGKTMQSVLINTTTKLQSFKLPDMRNLTFTDTIHLEEIGDEKTALFIIIPSSDTTFNFLAAMMYTQLFDVLYDRAINKFHGALPVHVRFILDEFANIGKIPNFDKLLATMRKFEISATIILQNLPQLKKLYEKNWSELPGNCDTLVFLGGMDEETCEYFSKKLGKETIDTITRNVTKSKQGSTSLNDGILGRELLTTDELSKIDNNECIVTVRGMYSFKTIKSDIVNHPRYNLLNENGDKSYDMERIKTLEETEIIDFSSFFAEGDNVVEENNNLHISYVLNNEKEVISTVDANENMAEINALGVQTIFSVSTAVAV